MSSMGSFADRLTIICDIFHLVCQVTHNVWLLHFLNANFIKFLKNGPWNEKCSLFNKQHKTLVTLELICDRRGQMAFYLTILWQSCGSPSITDVADWIIVISRAQLLARPWQLCQQSVHSHRQTNRHKSESGTQAHSRTHSQFAA